MGTLSPWTCSNLFTCDHPPPVHTSIGYVKCLCQCFCDTIVYHGSDILSETVSAKFLTELRYNDVSVTTSSEVGHTKKGLGDFLMTLRFEFHIQVVCVVRVLVGNRSNLFLLIWNLDFVSSITLNQTHKQYVTKEIWRVNQWLIQDFPDGRTWKRKKLDREGTSLAPPWIQIENKFHR